MKSGAKWRKKKERGNFSPNFPALFTHLLCPPPPPLSLSEFLKHTTVRPLTYNSLIYYYKIKSSQNLPRKQKNDFYENTKIFKSPKAEQKFGPWGQWELPNPKFWLRGGAGGQFPRNLNRPFARWHHLLLRPESFRVFFSCANCGFCHLNLAGVTKFKYEKRNEKDSGKSSKMTPSCNWPIDLKVKKATY